MSPGVLKADNVTVRLQNWCKKCLVKEKGF